MAKFCQYDGTLTSQRQPDHQIQSKLTPPIHRRNPPWSTTVYTLTIPITCPRQPWRTLFVYTKQTTQQCLAGTLSATCNPTTPTSEAKDTWKQQTWQNNTFWQPIADPNNNHSDCRWIPPHTLQTTATHDRAVLDRLIDVTCNNVLDEQPPHVSGHTHTWRSQRTLHVT